MPNPDQLRIIAVIPHADNPNRHIVDSEGNYPSKDHLDGTGTYEATFRTIGCDILGRVLSVDQRLVNLEKGDSITYLAKAVTKDPLPESGYNWQSPAV